MNHADPRVAVEFTALMAMKSHARHFHLPPKGKISRLLSGRHGSKFRGRGMNFEEFRHYQLGDDIRTLDWQVTLRTGEPHVRVYTEEREQPVILCVDQRSSMFFSSVDTMKSVVAAQVSACCAWKVIKDSDRVGALLFGDRDLHWYKPQRNPSHVSRILRSLSTLNQSLTHSDGTNSRESGGISRALAKLVRLKLKGSLLVFVSDFSELNEDDASKLRWLKQHNDVLGVSIQDPMESELHIPQALCLSDGEVQATVDSDVNRLLSGYNAQLNEEKRRVNRLIQNGGVPVIELDTKGEHIADFVKQISGGHFV